LIQETAPLACAAYAIRGEELSGHGTLASPPRGQTAMVWLTLQGTQREYRIGPRSYAEIGMP